MSEKDLTQELQILLLQYLSRHHLYVLTIYGGMRLLIFNSARLPLHSRPKRQCYSLPKTLRTRAMAIGNWTDEALFLKVVGNIPSYTHIGFFNVFDSLLMRPVKKTKAV